MSHYVVWVLIPSNSVLYAREVEDQVSKLLAPYNENEEVTPHTVECSCVGAEARHAGLDYVYKHLASYRESFNEKYKDANLPTFSERGEEAWNDHIAELEAERKRITEEHLLYNKPDPACEDCNGTGKITTRRNPQSKWDWWSLGGRWYRYIDNKDWWVPIDVDASVSYNAEKAFNSHSGDAALFGNVIYVDKLRQEQETFIGYLMAADWKLNNLTDEQRNHSVLPFAIVTPTGDWFAKGEMGWFASVSCRTDQERFQREGLAILERYKDHYAVICDLHI